MKTILLKRPLLQLDGTMLTQLSFREEAVAEDMIDVSLAKLDQMLTQDVLRIGGRLCAQPDHVMRKLGIADLAQVVEVVAGFLADTDPPTSGSTPSL